MSGPLSIEALARRRAGAVARRMRRDVPLLLEAGIERPPSQAEAEEQVIRQRQAGAAWAARLDASKRENRNKARWLRAFVAVRVSRESLKAIDDWCQRVLPEKMGPSPELVCDYWLRVLRDGAGVHPEGVDAQLATALGYPPVEPGIPITLTAWRAMKRDAVAEQRVLNLLRALDERREARQGGAQMALPGLLGGSQ